MRVRVTFQVILSWLEIRHVLYATISFNALHRCAEEPAPISVPLSFLVASAPVELEIYQ
jgi:hypothetical protein